MVLPPPLVEGRGVSAPVPLVVFDLLFDVSQVIFIKVVAFQWDYHSKFGIIEYVMVCAATLENIATLIQRLNRFVSGLHPITSFDDSIIHNNTQKVKGEYTKLRNTLMPRALSLGLILLRGCFRAVTQTLEFLLFRRICSIL